MVADQVFEAWAPTGGAWSDWVKPVLFAAMAREGDALMEAAARVEAGVDREGAEQIVALPPVDGQTVVVLDVETAAAVDVGLMLAERGCRPVPLFNSAAAGGEAQRTVEGRGTLGVCLDVGPVMMRLWRGAAVLRGLRLPLDAPPVFLLDAHRRTGRCAPAPGVFDNRWMSLPTDFPSGIALRERGMSRAVVVSIDGRIANDLAHTLMRWQEAGVDIWAGPLGRSPERITVRPPRWYGWVWHGVLSAMGFRRNWLGGFGGHLSASGGGG
jgi:hypothetical protein